MCPQEARPVLAGRCQLQPDVAVFPRPRSSIHDADPLRAIAQWISQIIRLRPPQPSSNTAKVFWGPSMILASGTSSFLPEESWSEREHHIERIGLLFCWVAMGGMSNLIVHSMTDAARLQWTYPSNPDFDIIMLIKMCFAWSNIAWSSFSATEWIVLTVNSHFMSVQSKEEMTLNMLKHVKTC